MSKNKATAALPYVERLAVNEYAQDKLLDAARQVQGAYRRASGRSPSKVPFDRKVQARLKRAGESLRDAAVMVRTGRKPRRRNLRPYVIGGAVIATAGGGAAGVALARRKAAQNDTSAQALEPTAA
jgi:hypothetical protein